MSKKLKAQIRANQKINKVAILKALKQDSYSKQFKQYEKAPFIVIMWHLYNEF